jgi:hypothetical protein
MNRQQIRAVMNDPGMLNQDTLDSIKVILDEYPFFHVGRLLWIKNLHVLDHIRYNNELKLAAAHLPDRRKLYELIFSATTVEPSTSTKDVAPVVSIAGVNQSTVKEQQEEVLSAEVGTETEAVPEKTESRVGKQEVSIRSVSVESGRETDSEVRFAFPAFIDSLEMPDNYLLEYEIGGNTIYNLEEETGDKFDEARSFSDWLSVLKSSPIAAQKKQEAETKQVSKKDLLIESFLQGGRKKKIEPVSEGAGVGTEDIAAKSLEEKDDLITETLANIYIKQKNFIKARDIFERLRLKYPEKSVYFARRIEQINNQ